MFLDIKFKEFKINNIYNIKLSSINIPEEHLDYINNLKSNIKTAIQQYVLISDSDYKKNIDNIINVI